MYTVLHGMLRVGFREFVRLATLALGAPTKRRLLHFENQNTFQPQFLFIYSYLYLLTP